MPRARLDPRNALFFWSEISRNAHLVWRLFRDSRVPLGPKMVLPATLFYIVFPIDLLPDLIPGVGQLDDIAILLFGLRMFIEMCPRHLVREHQNTMEHGKGSTHRGTRPGAPNATTIEGAYRIVDE